MLFSLLDLSRFALIFTMRDEVWDVSPLSKSKERINPVQNDTGVSSRG